MCVAHQCLALSKIMHPLLLLLPMSDVYRGNMMGVRAQVTLQYGPGNAHVHLTGGPMCGTVSGYAHFAENGSVRLDPRLNMALKRRMCTVRAVMRLNEEKLRVTLELPIFGRRSLIMTRDTSTVYT